MPRAVKFTQYGDIDVLEVVEVPRPVPAAEGPRPPADPAQRRAWLKAGLDEIFALSDIKTYATSGEWDLLVVDCAPTAETIRFRDHVEPGQIPADGTAIPSGHPRNRNRRPFRTSPARPGP